MNSRAIVSGFAATAVMLVAFVVAYGLAIGLSALDLVQSRGAETMHSWLTGLTNNRLIDIGRDNLYATLAIYILAGVVWAVLYARIFEPRLPGASWQRG